MINLIPNKEKRRMARGFYYRLAVVYLLALSFPILIGGVVMIPSFFLTYVKKDLVNKKLETQKNEPVPLVEERTLSIIKDLDNKLNLVENTENNRYSVSQKVINTIILKKMPNIKITDIFYEDNSPNELLQGKKVNIQGTAPSRETLLLFRQALEDDVTFKSVNLPVSNFVKGSNIQFYLSLIPK